MSDEQDPELEQERTRLFLQRREHLIAAAETTVKLGEWDFWLGHCVEAWDAAVADNSELELTLYGAMNQLETFTGTMCRES
jgi:hypothetical protein